MKDIELKIKTVEVPAYEELNIGRELGKQCRVLWLQVIRIACHECFDSNPDTRYEARAWIFNDGAENNGLISLCKYFGFNERVVRQRVLSCNSKREYMTFCSPKKQEFIEDDY